MLHRQNINSQLNSRFTPATNLKIGTYILIPNFKTQKGISKKLKPLRKRPYRIVDKPTDVTHELIDLSKKEIVQHSKNLLPYYLKVYALRELTQLYFSAGLKVIHNNSDDKQNQNTEMNFFEKPLERNKKKKLTMKNLKIR